MRSVPKHQLSCPFIPRLSRVSRAERSAIPFPVRVPPRRKGLAPLSSPRRWLRVPSRLLYEISGARPTVPQWQTAPAPAAVPRPALLLRCSPRFWMHTNPAFGVFGEIMRTEFAGQRCLFDPQRRKGTTRLKDTSGRSITGTTHPTACWPPGRIGVRPFYDLLALLEDQYAAFRFDRRLSPTFQKISHLSLS